MSKYKFKLQKLLDIRIDEEEESETVENDLKKQIKYDII